MADLKGLRRHLPLVLSAAAFAGAAVFFWSVTMEAGRPGRAELEDREGDVVGTAPAEVAPLIDLVSAVVQAAPGGEITISWTVSAPITPERLRAAGDVTGRFEAHLERAGIRHSVVVLVSSGGLRAQVIDHRNRDRPYVVDSARLGGRTVSVDVPREAVEELGAAFTYWVAAGMAGSHDHAPAGRAAQFPPPT